MNAKKIISLIVCLALILPLVACGGEATGNGEATEDGNDSVTEPEKVKITIGSGQSREGFMWIRGMTDIFMPAIEEKLAETNNYEIEWVEGWGGTIAGVADCLEYVEDGLMDISMAIYVFEQSKLPLGNVTYNTPFAVGDTADMQEIWLELVEMHPELIDEITQYNQIPVAWCPGEPYNISSTFEYTGLDSLEGNRVGAAGTNLAWCPPSLTKIQSNGTEAYNSLQTGLYEMAMQPTSFHSLLFYYEQAPYFLKADFGCVGMGAVTVNKDFMEGLPEEVQEAIRYGGEKYTEGIVEMTQKNYDLALEDLNENCEKVIDFTDEQKKEWAATLDEVPLTYVETKEEEGIEGIRSVMVDYLKLCNESGQEVIRDWTNSFN